MSQTQLAKGFDRAKERLEDSKLDCPHAEDILRQITMHGREQKWLEAESA